MTRRDEFETCTRAVRWRWWVVVVVGSLTSKAVAHGTLDWTCTERERRVVMLKYCPGHVAWGREYVTSRTPELIRSVTERQRALLQPPFVYERHKWDDKVGGGGTAAGPSFD